MDRLANWTHDINATTSAPVTGQNCVSNTSNAVILDKLLVTAPSWSSVQQDLTWIFLLHIYGFACLFFILGFYTFFSILNLRSLISSRPFMSTINVFLCLLGVSRAACLFIDSYNLKETMPKVIGLIMWDIGYPCITSAFCLIQLAFLQLTQLKFGPERMQKESCLSLIITAHFFFIIASDIVLVTHNCYLAKYVLQTIFLMCNVLIYLTFLHAGYKINHLLRTMPSSMLTRDNSTAHQKGIMQLAMLAPYSNLATSVAAALVPTLFGPKIKDPEETEATNANKNTEEVSQESRVTTTAKVCKIEEPVQKEVYNPTIPTCIVQSPSHEQKSAVPEVYVRPPTPTPSTANLPIITVSSPSRRSSVASRRGSDTSAKSSRRNSECSVRFINEEDTSSMTECRRTTEGSPRHIPRMRDEIERSRSPDSISRRYSENITPTGSIRELRRCSDFTHEKNRGSQFATKLRRNSDFGNRTPRRMLPPDEHSRLPKVLDLSPTGSRRNSDIGTFVQPRVDSRRNSESTCRRNSEFIHIKPLIINRRSSDISIRTLDRSPTHFQSIVPPVKVETQEKSESDSDQPDCSEKAALMNEKAKSKNEETKLRKKNLSWKNMEDPEDITAETNLLPENTSSEARVVGTDFTLHSILNHIAYVNRAKSDTPLHIPEANTAAARKSQVQRVLNVTYATAILGIILCVVDVARIFGPYGLLAETVPYGIEPATMQFPKPWPWLLYQTLCRALELAMGCAMASITKQPSVSPRHQYLNSYPNYSARVKRGNNLYI
ncbi:uncharacterized protein LOC105189677 [Harpegnathos saltator]|uniref:Proline-rich transmembrane protein 3/4 domain-containing protein n=1 Tax=Harpegnathos saltator TaxID=610380 RepID=E2C3V2_HARSA|nr:uncharacterized protein LOC105189677 [Harpegnathos saltator]EFN77338.1 hypothetical protein EAI_14468 [Harpegnathos saltator]